MVIASIDLMDGKAVQLRQGKEKVLQREDALQLAREFDRFGEVAVIDLDAAMGQGSNLPLIKEILKIAECRVGGGIRSVEQARELLSLGARKVIVGSKAFEDDRVNRGFLEELSTALSPEHIIVAVDALNEEIVTRGWKHRTGLNLYQTARQVAPYAGELLFTCVEREGTMQGLDLELVKRLKTASPVRITAAGGVKRLEEVKNLAAMDVDVQLGMALYTGKIHLGDAFVESLNWKGGLLPTIVQDLSRQVLMLAFSSKASLKKSFDSGKMTYYSRSRKTLWTKGETSGHWQRLKRLRADCDRDSLLAVVEQTGVACHTGSYSCFGDKQFSLAELYDVIQERLANPQPGSYTAKLKGDLLKEKILEEAREVVEAQKREDIIWEAADIFYFLTVLLAKHKIALEEVLQELRRRRKK